MPFKKCADYRQTERLHSGLSIITISMRAAIPVILAMIMTVPKTTQASSCMEKTVQTLNMELEPNTTYSLSLMSGTRTDNSHFGGYAVELKTTCGETVLSWTGANRNLAPRGSFRKIGRSITTGPSPRGMGSTLQIILGRPSQNNDDYFDFDDVQLTATPAKTRPGDQPIKVFLLAGQSNAHGWTANVDQLSEENKVYAQHPSTSALLSYQQKNLPEPIYSSGSVAHLSTQGSGFNGNFEGFGPELSLGTELANGLSHPIAIFKFTVGSAGLAKHFAKSRPLDPDPNNHLYPEMLRFIKSSLGELVAQGYQPKIQCLFWLQGETDAEAMDSANAYSENISRFIDDVRRDLDAPDSKVFLTEINENTSSLRNRPVEASAVNAGMLEAARNDPKVTIISTRDIKDGFSDYIHYNADQTIEIGRRWAKAFLDKELTYSPGQPKPVL